MKELSEIISVSLNWRTTKRQFRWHVSHAKWWRKWLRAPSECSGESSSFLSNFQFGFYKHRSTDHPLLRLNCEIRGAFSPGLMNIVFFFDKKKLMAQPGELIFLLKLHTLPPLCSSFCRTYPFGVSMFYRATLLFMKVFHKEVSKLYFNLLLITPTLSWWEVPDNL